jgi:hypothetical protein
MPAPIVALAAETAAEPATERWAERSRLRLTLEQPLRTETSH